MDKRVVAGHPAASPSATCSCAASAPSPASSRPASITSGPSGCSARSTNNLLKNIGWAKKGILSFSNMPLNMLSFLGVLLLVVTFGLMVLQVLGKLLFPGLAPPGVTTVLLAIMFFGSLNFFGIGILGEYLAKIFEEVKRRPLFIRRSIIRDGEVRMAHEASTPPPEAKP